MNIPSKPVGRIYAVVMKSPDFSRWKLASMGAFGGEATAPTVAAGTRCTCCNVPTTRTQKLDASTDRIEVEPFDLPVCLDCKDHALRRTIVEAMMGIGLIVLGALGALGVMNESPALMIAGFAPAASLITFLFLRRARRFAFARAGHHAGLEIGAHAGLTVVRTSNRRLVEELVARNGDAITRIR